MFFLTLFLAGQVVGTMAEERSNKVIEVLAAAVPLEAVFLGKLLGMFGVAVLFIGFWGTVLGQVASLLPPAFAGMVGELSPAVGLPMFVMLFVAYFTMAYLLLGSVFLTIGAQASTMREIQMLSLPITIIQVGMFTLTLSGCRSRAAGWRWWPRCFRSPHRSRWRAWRRPAMRCGRMRWRWRGRLCGWRCS